MAVTIKDIAIRTGLAISTISKYLNGGNVLPENQVKIQKTIDELGFSANSFARGLKTNKSYRIGMVVESLSDQMQAGIVSRLEPILRRHSYTTVIADCGNDIGSQSDAVDYLLAANVDALVVIPMVDQGVADTCRQREIPVIAVLSKPDTTDVDCVLLDNYSAAYSAVRYIISFQHKKIAFIGGPENDSEAQGRYAGYTAALKNARISIAPEYVSFGEYSSSSGYERMKMMMRQPHPPTAALITDFRTTFGALIAVKEMKLDIPGDLALVGFGNVELAQAMTPKIHVMVNSLDRIASTVSSLLMERLSEKSPSPAQIFKLPAEFFIGESV